jgi:anti-anti-sigma factor
VPNIESQVQDGLLVVRRTAEDDRVRIALVGELDLANAKTAEAVVLEALASDKNVLVDLTGLEFLDSSGVSLLVTALRLRQCHLTFLPSESFDVCRLLSLTGLDARMEFVTEEPLEPPALPAG